MDDLHSLVVFHTDLVWEVSDRLLVSCQRESSRHWFFFFIQGRGRVFRGRGGPMPGGPMIPMGGPMGPPMGGGGGEFSC